MYLLLNEVYTCKCFFTVYQESQRAEIERSKQNEKKQEEKEPLRKMEDPPGPGYSLPSSIFSNIPDVGLCTFEEEIAAVKTSSIR